MSKLKILPLGGLGEIGKNMMVYEYEDDILIVDTGIMFPNNDMLGIDYIIPDFEYLLSEDKRSKVKGIIITHGHEDHTGAINHIVDKIQAPIYATALTRGLLEVKLNKRNNLGLADLRTVNAGDSAKIGVFDVEFCHVSHSIPDAVALGINTPEGLIVHTGDYKFDHTPVDNWPTDYAKLSEWSSRGVLALMADSTNADKPGWTASERSIDAAFDKVFSEAKGRIIVASFASLISRVQQVANATQAVGRKIAFAGMSMRDNQKMARKLGYLKIPEETIVSLEVALKMPPSKVVLMCTGSQGEPTSIMGRLASGRNRQFDIIKGDTVVLSSHPIPGNEETVYQTINKLIQRGAKMVYSPIEDVHVSGHASAEEMKLMLHLIKPKYLVPIHGELRHLYLHAEMAEEIGIPKENIAVVENGTPIEFESEIMSIGDRIPGGYVFVDGLRVGTVGPAVVREREALSKDGVIFININIDSQSWEMIGRPDIITRGFIYKYSAEEMLSEIEREIVHKLKSSNGNAKNDIKKHLKSFLHGKTKRHPMIFVVVNEF
jgi:ribonuclease J